MLQQIQTKYMTALRQGTELRTEDLGAVRLAMRMALEELHLQYRHDLADMDDIIADMLQERDQLKATTSMDASEILRLQTMEDLLITWVHEHAPDVADSLVATDTASVVIDLLTKYQRATQTQRIVAPVSVNLNGNGNGHVQITDLSTRYPGRRLKVDTEQLRQLAIAKIQVMAINLGRTPTQNDWNQNLGPDEPSLTSVKNRLGKSWNELIADAGLTPNDGMAAMREAKAAKTSHKHKEEEARTDDAAATFRSE